MSAERVIANGLRIAREDLSGARLLASAGNHNAAYATTYRYPTSARVPAGPAATELEAQLRRLDQILTRVSQCFGVDLDAAGTVARTPGPIR